MKTRIVWVVALAALALASAGRVQAYDETHHGHNARYRASLRPWHGRWYNVQHGQAVAVVVPPTSELTTDYSWGAVSSRMTRIDHQFQRPWPNGYWTPYGFMPTPAVPSDTRQTGYYYIRGPW
ncbi:MAG: hypothetical protein WD063_11755 [Pirellulales bacterium]